MASGTFDDIGRDPAKVQNPATRPVIPAFIAVDLPDGRRETVVIPPDWTTPMPEDAITPSRRRVPQWHGVHFAIADGAWEAMAAACGLSRREFARQAEVQWHFSDDPAEDYDFEALDPDFRPNRTAGSAAGPFAAHSYVTPGEHRVSVAVYRSGIRFTAETSLRCAAIDWAARSTAIVDPDGDLPDPLPVGLTNARRLTDLREALLGLEKGRFDTLLLNRGKRYPLLGRPGGRWPGRADYTIGHRQIVMAVGQGARPLILPVFDDGTAGTVEGIRLWRQQIDGSEIASAGQSRFALAGRGGEGALAVYVDGRLAPPDSYRVENRSIVFNRSPDGGQRILAVRRRGAGIVSTRTRSLLQIRSRSADGDSDALLHGLHIQGGYDPTNPGKFDPEDLSTFQPEPQLYAVRFSAFGGNLLHHCTLFGSAVTGMGACLGGSANSSHMFVVNCRLKDWADYGVYSRRGRALSVVGCSLRQAPGALNGPGGKVWNMPGQRNYPDHGPLRVASQFEDVVNRCALASWTSWTVSGLAARGAQPSIRPVHGGRAGQSVSITECHHSGTGAFLAGGPPNFAVPWPAYGLIHVARNWVELGPNNAISNSMVPLASIGNVYILIAGRHHRNALLFNRANGEGHYHYDANGDFDGATSFHDTFLILADRPDSTLTLTRRMLINDGSIQQTGPRGQQVPPTVVTAPTVEIAVVINRADFLLRGDRQWRIWISPDGDPSHAVAFDTPAAQAAAMVFNPEGPGDLAGGGTSVRVRRIDGDVFRAGTHLWISAEVTTARYGRRDAQGRIFPPGHGEAHFFANNRLQAVPEVAFVNPVILIAGAWAKARIKASAPPVALATHRPAAFAPITAFGQPQPGSPALARIPRAEGARLDWRGRERPESMVALGALEADTDLADFRPVPRHPHAFATWRADRLIAGATISADEMADLVIRDPGEPPLDPATITLFLEQRRPDGTQRMAKTVTPAVGDIIRIVTDYTHPSAGRRMVRNAPKTVR